jgi:hypothetical protein
MAYRLPGVTVQIIDNPANAILPPGLRIPCIIATGLTTLPVKNTQVTRGAGSFDVITGALSANTFGAINGTVSTVVAVGDFPDLKQYIPGTDWAQVDNQIQWLGGGNAPALNATYYVSYATPKLASFYNNGILYTSLNDVRNDMGAELIAGVVNPVTAAAKLCFDNGASLVMIIQPPTAAVGDIQNAITAAVQQDVDIVVVPQACNSTLDNFVRSHVLSQSAPSVRHERVWFTSSDGTSDAVTTIMAKAQGMFHERVTVMAPPAFVTTFTDSVTTQSQDQLLPSGYLAAAYAGIATAPSSDAATPLTRKSFVDVKNLSTFNYTNVDKLNLGGAGVTIVENNKGIFRVMQGLTTDTSNVNRAAQSVVFIKDNIRKDLRTLLDASFIGVKIDNSLASRIASTIDAFLAQKVHDVIIRAYNGILVVQDSIDPRTLRITFNIAPIYPAEYIDITVSLFV